MLRLSIKESEIHTKAVGAGKRYRLAEIHILKNLQAVQNSRVFTKLGHTSLFQYATKEMKLSESTAASAIAVARKASIFPDLQRAFLTKELTISVANKIVSALTHENSKELVEFAKTHSCREIERKVAGLNPRANPKDRVKPVSENLMRLEITLTQEEYALVCRARDLEAQKTGSVVSLKEALVAATKTHVKKNDPLQKAKRARSGVNSSREEFRVKQGSTQATSERSQKPRFQRVPLKAGEKYAVYSKTNGQCTYVNRTGERCSNRRWLGIHHIKPISEGGTNMPENLTLLCWYHHDLIHQMEFPITDEGA